MDLEYASCAALAGLFLIVAVVVFLEPTPTGPTLSVTQSRADKYKREFELLESRITQEQIRANRAESQARLIRRRSDIGLPAVSSSYPLRPPSLSDVILIIHFFWRLSRVLCEKVTRLATTISVLRASLQSIRNSYNNLRLDRQILKAYTEDFRGRLERSSSANEDIALQLLRLQAHHARSLNHRQQAAQSWIRFRCQTDHLRTKTFCSLLKIIGVLWHLTIQLRNALRDEKAAHTSAQIACTSLVSCIETTRKEYKDSVSLLKTTNANLEERNHELELACQRKQDELTERHLSHDRLMESQIALEHLNQRTREELVKLNEQHDGLQLKYNRLTAAHAELHREHASLSSRHLHLATENAALDNAHKDLTAHHMLVSAQLNTLTGQHLALSTTHDQLVTQQAALQSSHSELVLANRTLMARRDELQGQCASLEKRIAEHNEAHDATSASLTLLRSQHTHLYGLYQDVSARADRAESREVELNTSLTASQAECFQLASECTMSAERDGHMISALVAHTIALEAYAEQQQYFMENTFKPVQRVMKSVGWQINQVTPSLVSPPPSSFALRTPVLARDVFGQLPTPSSDGLIALAESKATVAATPSRFASTGSSPYVNDFFSTSVRCAL
ncbi:hypothetical protein K488DRAFT_67187 [Vararia minispora EC-137]|uniref:Uncharacterized protein n=1 Tax=Vararia minispora EC-137 TaxID=1314806 RepID=A0ACB8QZP3_9AGAM|nr:hypothetical protein K488DRAFT_67187 [Vararia minispora EC-137]